VLAGVGLVVVLAAVGAGVWIWALGHWFVGVEGSGDGEHVAVFRGLPASVIGVDLYRVDHPTDLAVADLTPAARSRVRKGIAAGGSADAARILAALRDQRLPVCASSSAGGTDAGPVPGAASVAPTSPTTGALPTPAAAPTTTPPDGADTGSTAPMSSPTPGVDCREAK
jgi:protein phosphatase